MSNLIAPFGSNDALVIKKAPTTPSLPNAIPCLWHPTSKIELVLPAVFQVKQDSLRTIRSVDINMTAFFYQELNISRLNRLHKHLWLAGLPQPARSLNAQIQMGMGIRITDRMDMHMLWSGHEIHLRPLSTYLFSSEIWTEQLCKDAMLYNTAMGFLLSYTWLVTNAADHKIAVDNCLLDSRISWEAWAGFVRVLINHGLLTSKTLNPRFRFGELRLTRVDWLHRFCTVAKRDGQSLIRGYHYIYRNYTTFLQAQLTWLLTAFLWIVLVLTAMQTGLATDHLKNNTGFQKASWGLVVFAIVAPIIVVVAVLCFLLVVVLKNLAFTRSKQGRAKAEDVVWHHSALKAYKH